MCVFYKAGMPFDLLASKYNNIIQFCIFVALIFFYMSDKYQTIVAPTTGEFKDRGSKFIAYAYPAATEKEWQEALLEVKKIHPKARHHCFAYRLGMDKNNYRANDDGEPSGSAGRPILGQIDSFGLTNVFVVVVRYFGGTKLGVPGLINAYKVSTEEALNAAEVVEKTIKDVFQLQFDYGLMSQVMNAIKSTPAEMLETDYGDTASINIALAQSDIDTAMIKIKSTVAGCYPEEEEKMENIDGFAIKYLHTI